MIFVALRGDMMGLLNKHNRWFPPVRSHVIASPRMPIIMLPNLSPSPNLYKVQSVYNNNVAS